MLPGLPAALQARGGPLPRGAGVVRRGDGGTPLAAEGLAVTSSLGARVASPFGRRWVPGGGGGGSGEIRGGEGLAGVGVRGRWRRGGGWGEIAADRSFPCGLALFLRPLGVFFSFQYVILWSGFVSLLSLGFLFFFYPTICGLVLLRL